MSNSDHEGSIESDNDRLDVVSQQSIPEDEESVSTSSTTKETKDSYHGTSSLASDDNNKECPVEGVFSGELVDQLEPGLGFQNKKRPYNCSYCKVAGT